MTIHVLGDSHTKVFLGLGFKVMEWAWCAHNLHRKQELRQYIEKYIKEGDSIIWVFGEVDCRNHIYYQCMKRGGKDSVTDLIKETMERYGEVIARYSQYRFAVYNVVPAGRWPKGWRNNPRWGTTPPAARVAIHRKFHAALSALCRQRGWPEIDIWPYVLGPDGHAKVEYTCDDVHLNGKVVPFIVAELRKVWGIK